VRWLLISSLLALGLSSAWAVYPPPVKDEAKFFKPETLEKAGKKIHDIYRQYRKDLVVETLPAIPSDQEKKFKEVGKARFFSSWAERRVDELGVNGIYVLIVRDPKYVQIGEDERTRNKSFPLSARNKLRDTMVRLFSGDKFDDGLLAGLDFVESTLKAHSGK
jgi:hypothetical protein